MTFSTQAGPCSGVLPLRDGAPPWSHVRACGVIAGAQVPSRSPGRSPRPVSFLSKRLTAVSSAPSPVTAQATGRALVPADMDHAKPGDRSTSDAKGGRKRGRRRGTVKPIRAEVPRRPEPPFLVGAGSRGSGRHPVHPPLALCRGRSPAVVRPVSHAVCGPRARTRRGHGRAGLLPRDGGSIRPANSAGFQLRGAWWASQNLLEEPVTRVCGELAALPRAELAFSEHRVLC